MAIADLFKKNKEKIVKKLSDDERKKVIEDYKKSQDFKKDAEGYLDGEMQEFLKDFTTNDGGEKKAKVETEKVEPAKEKEEKEAPIVEPREEKDE